jgi:hypothetical protein
LRIRIRIIFGSWVRIRCKVKIQELLRLKMEWKAVKMEAWRLKMEAWRVLWSQILFSVHFDEEQDPDPELDPH